MYSPQYAIETNREAINSVIRENPFATLTYVENDEIQSFHLPLALEGEKLVGHLALANPAWKALGNSSVLVIFHGPHCYISPEWYGTPGNVPTWNYISIQVRGMVSIKTDGEFLKESLIKLGRLNDSSFDIKKNVEDNSRLLAGIVGIEISITDIFAKFKLAQSKGEDERKRVIAKLEASTNTMDQQVAKAMALTLTAVGHKS